MGTGKGLLDSLIAEGGVKSWEIRRIGMQLNFMAIPISLFI